MTDASFQIHVKDLRCTAFHGVYPLERTSGQEFRVDMTVSYPVSHAVERIGQTVDYAGLILIIREVMSETEELLETVAQKMATRVHGAHPFIGEINISIEKIAAAIPNFGGRVGVTYQKKYL